MIPVPHWFIFSLNNASPYSSLYVTVFHVFTAPSKSLHSFNLQRQTLAFNLQRQTLAPMVRRRGLLLTPAGYSAVYTPTVLFSTHL